MTFKTVVAGYQQYAFLVPYNDPMTPRCQPVFDGWMRNSSERRGRLWDARYSVAGERQRVKGILDSVSCRSTFAGCSMDWQDSLKQEERMRL
jgi:hypothetical protein